MIMRVKFIILNRVTQKKKYNRNIALELKKNSVHVF